MTELSAYSPRQHDVRRHFDRIGADFDQADTVHRVCGDGLLERLQPMKLDPARIVELGCATGSLCRQLLRRFRGSQVVGVDLSLAMLRESRRRRRLFSPLRLVQASADRLPFPDHSIDIILANQLLPWLGTSAAVFAEIARTLRPEGLFAFSSLGPDSLAELRSAFDDGDAHVHRFADMHEVGDALIRAGLQDPVLDVDRLELRYRDTGTLYRDLHRAGGNTLAGRRTTLTGKERFARADRALRETFEHGRLDLNLELVYGHAWGGKRAARSGEFRIDADSLRGRRRPS